MKTEKLNKAKEDRTNQLTISVLLFMIAIVSVVAATVAWFSIADHTKVQSMNMEVTSGVSLRFDLDKHKTFDEYIKTLSFQAIAGRIKSEKGFDMTTTPLAPVTTNDCVKFTYEDGRISQSTSGDYLEFTLNFMSTEDMVVHLTSVNGSNGMGGTKVSSTDANLPQAMRISFTIEDKTYIYDPGIGDTKFENGNISTFGLADASHMEYNDNNALFFIKANVNVPVVVHVWMEGTDEKCTDELRGKDYSISLRFVGTDKDNVLLSDTDKEELENCKEKTTDETDDSME